MPCPPIHSLPSQSATEYLQTAFNPAVHMEEQMKELLRKIDAEYGFKLTEEEMDRIAKEAKEAEGLFRQLNEVDVAGKTPLMKLALKGTK